MAIKIFCNICNRFIKDMDTSKDSFPSGEEICPPCSKRTQKAFSELDALQKEAHKGAADLDREHAKLLNAIQEQHKQLRDRINRHFIELRERLKRAIENTINPEEPKKGERKPDGENLQSKVLTS